MSKTDTVFSAEAKRELSILYSLLSQIIDYSEMSFRKRDEKASMQIEPLVRVGWELINQLKQNHFERMSNGVCDIMADAIFSNLMVECKRITNICSNIGVATMVRIRPELADHEHLYYETLHNSGDEAFDKAFAKAHDIYFAQLEA